MGAICNPVCNICFNTHINDDLMSDGTPKTREERAALLAKVQTLIQEQDLHDFQVTQLDDDKFMATFEEDYNEPSLVDDA